MNAEDALRTIRANLQRVTDRIETAAQGRAVTLVCITKYATDNWVGLLLTAGVTDLGENLLPRAAERFEALTTAGFRFKRHLIGAQQSRKLKLIPGRFDCLQALDRLPAAETLQQLLLEQQLSLDVLVQVNIGNEPQKHGFAPAEAATACSYIRDRCSRLCLRGLMAVPPAPDAYQSQPKFESGTRGYFRQMREMFATMPARCGTLPAWDTLSLGMSLDYVWAIEEGATMVRVGSALFEGLEG